MISKEKFVDILNQIEITREKEEELRKSFEAFSKDSRCDIFLFSEYEDTIIDLLKDMFNDLDEDIAYFVYEMNFCKDKDIYCCMDDEMPLYRNSGELYDYLVENNL